MELDFLKKYLDIAIESALRGGAEIMDVYRQADVAIRLKADQSPVTEADMRSHRAIVGLLESSSIPVLSEEGIDIPHSKRCSWPLIWIVDPMDGTKEFIKRNGEFTVNIALVENHRPILGIIFVPVKGWLYVGYRNTAMRYHCDNWLHLSVEQFVSQSHSELLPSHAPIPLTVVASISHPCEAVSQYIDNLRVRHGEVLVRSVGSSLKFCLLAEGGAHLYPRFGHIMEWDTAAGQALLEAAGGHLLALPERKPMRYNREDLRNPFFIALSSGADLAWLE